MRRLLLPILLLALCAPATANIGSGAIRHGIIGSAADPNGVRGGGKIGGGKGLRGPPAGKGPGGGGLPQEALLSWWYDSEERGASEEPVNQGTGSYAAMVADGGTPAVVTATVGATDNVEVWKQASTTARWLSDDGNGAASPITVDTGESATFFFLYSPLSLGDGLENFAAAQRANSSVPGMNFENLRSGTTTITYTLRYDAGGGTVQIGFPAADLALFYVAIIIHNNSQPGGSGGGNYDMYIRPLESGSSWTANSAGASETLRTNHSMFMSGDEYNGGIQSWGFYPGIALTSDERDAVYDYFANRFGEG